jgi:hypothetical protein
MVSAGTVMFEEVIIEKGIKGRGQFRIHKLRKGRHRPEERGKRNVTEKGRTGDKDMQANRHKSR